MLQHAWAAVDRKLVYRSEDLIPEQLKGRLARVSALLRQADEQFSECRRERSYLRASYDERVKAGDLSEPIHRLSIDAYAHCARQMERVQGAAAGAGYTLYETQTARVDEGTINILRNVGISSLEDLDELLRGNEALQDDLAWYLGAYLAMPEFDDYLVARDQRSNTNVAGLLRIAVSVTVVGRQDDFLSFAVEAGRLVTYPARDKR